MSIDFSAILKKMKESRTLWAGLVGLILVVGRTAFPEFPITDAVLAPAFIAIISYVGAEGLEGFRPAPKVLETLFASRKFLLTVSALILVIVNNINPEFPLDQAQILWLVKGVAGLNIAMGAEGFVKK